MGSSESKPSVSIEHGRDSIKVSTPDQFQYTYFSADQEGCKFGISATNDAYIALSSNQYDPEYEILIGMSYNTKTIIKKRKATMTRTILPNLLHKDEFRYFWIKWKNNKILLGRENEQQAFIYFDDYENIPINYFGICTSNGSTGKWIIEKKFKNEMPSPPKYTETGSTASTPPTYSHAMNLPPYVASSSKLYPTAPPHYSTTTEKVTVVTKKKSNIDTENTKTKTNNMTKPENSNKPTNPVNYLNNFKDLNIKNNYSENSTSKDNFEKVSITKTKTEHNQTSKTNTRKQHNGGRRSKTVNNSTRNQYECDGIISFDKLVEISRKSPELILVELQPYKFERLFEIKLRRNYINIALRILSKLCQADFLGDKKSVIVGFFSKEVFRKQILNYLYDLRLQSDEDYNRHLRYTKDMWDALYIVCKTAATIPTELHSGYLENLVFECHNTLEALVSRDESRKSVLEKFTKLKEFIYFETRRRPLF